MIGAPGHHHELPMRNSAYDLAVRSRIWKVTSAKMLRRTNS